MDIEKQQYIRKTENEQKIFRKKTLDPNATPETSKTLAFLYVNKSKIDDMIAECKDGQKNLESRLKVVLAECRSLSKNQKQLKSDVTMSNNQTRIVDRENQKTFVKGLKQDEEDDDSDENLDFKDEEEQKKTSRSSNRAKRDLFHQ